MRDIKFRAYQDFKIIYQEKSGVYGAKSFLDKCYEDCEVMQFTGMKDKNKKEIYEGDIVKISQFNFAYDEIDAPNEPKFIETISIIEYRDHGFWVKDEDFGYEGEDLWDWGLIEVIGNIYQNPELI